MHCIECGQQLPEGAKFCSGCGKAVAVAPQLKPPRIARNAVRQDNPNAVKPWTKEQGCGCLLLGAIGLAVLVSFGGGGEKSEANRKAEAAKTAEDRRKGFHCLSSWDGSNRSLVQQIKANLRDPDSFEHDETKITPERNGQHMVTMRYRAKNGFGGMNVATALATIDHSSCAATIVSTGE